MPSGSLIGNLAVLLSMETASFEKGNTHAQKLLVQTQKQFESMAKKIAGVGVGMTAAITTPLLGFGATAIKEANESAQAMAQVEAALTSMGPKAGRTAEQLKAAADAMEMRSLAEGDEILRKVTANLLTFGNISGAAFDKAQQAALDLSARMGTDLQSAAILVGKALNDPVKGMAALGRAGIQFSASQKEVIKSMVATGNTAGAQAIILAEFQKQFGGAAQAAQSTDPMNKANDAFKQMAETVGNALLPIIPVFTDAVVSVAQAFSSLSPETQKWVIIGGAAAAAIGPILIGIGGLVSALGLLLPAIVPVVAGIASFAAIITGTAIPAIGAFLVAFSPILIPLAAVAAAIAGVYLAWKNWDLIAPILANLYNAAKTWLFDKLGAVFTWVGSKLSWIGDKFKWLYDVVVGHSYIPDMVDGIGRHMARLDAVMVAPTAAATSKTAQAFRALQSTVSGILNQLFPEQARHNRFVDEMKALMDYAAQAKMPVEELAEAMRRLREQYAGDALGPAQGISDSILKAELPETADTWSVALETIVGKSKTATVQVAKSFEDMIKTINSSLQSFASAIKGGGFFDIIGALVDLTATLASAGVFGSKIQTRMNKSYANRASGGPVFAGRTYMVGERGKEFFTPSQSGYIKPNNDNAAQRNVHVTVTPSPLFEVKIQQSETRGAVRGAQMVQEQMSRASRRRLA